MRCDFYYFRRGRCLIFENVKFDSHLGLEYRHGSDKDRQLMEAIFTELQFEVCRVRVHNMYNNVKPGLSKFVQCISETTKWSLILGCTVVQAIIKDHVQGFSLLIIYSDLIQTR
jgi:hypothetical protein